MDSDSLMQLIIILVLLMFSAFFSASETALTMVNKVRLKTLADEGNKKAARVLKILNDYGGSKISPCGIDHLFNSINLRHPCDRINDGPHHKRRE